MSDYTRTWKALSKISDKPHIFLAPIYAWRYPRPVEELIRQAELKGSREVYCITTRESQSGKAGDYMRNIIEGKGLVFKGFTSVNMPNEYLLSNPVSAPEETKKYLCSILPELQKMTDTIQSGGTLTDNGNVGMPGLMSGVVNAAANRFLMTSKNFTVSDACIGCGACEKRCPMVNITMKDGRPIFDKKCTWCFSCIQYCPKAAIDIGKRTAGKQRYVCPDYKTFMKEAGNIE